MMTIEYERRQARRRPKQTLNTETQKAIKSLIITLTSMIVVLLIIFLTATTFGAEKGYSLEQAKLENEHLKAVNENLKTKIINSTATNNLEENKQIEKMSEIEKKLYVTEEDNKVK